MRNTFLTLLLTYVSTFVFAQNTAHFEWLTGTWRGPGFNGTFEEVWSVPDTNGHLMGMFRYFDAAGKVQFYEFWVLDETGMKLRHFNPDFTAWEDKSKFIDFTMVETTETKVTLKGLTYEHVSTNEMKVSLRLKIGDEVNTEIFNLQRVRVPISALNISQVVKPHTIEVRFSDEPYEFTTSEREIITNIATQAETDVRKLLPTLDGDLVLSVTGGTRVIEVTGEAGLALSPGRILWVVNHEDPRSVATIAKAQLRHTLFHEVHHLARGWLIEGGTVPKSILDAAVSEGMATAFARDYSNEDAPWAKYPEDIDQWVRELQYLPGDALYDEWMFKHPDGRLWIGYRAGTYLVDRAMAKSGKTSVSLLTVPVQEIVEMGKD
jgi:hypothetical protein